MGALLYSIAATIIVSLVSFVGIATFFFKGKTLEKALLPLVGFSAGVMLGGAFLHLIPDAFSEFGAQNIGAYVVSGIAVFFLVERVLHWHHCHKHGACGVKSYAYMNLVGDGVHNFLDGLIIAGSFVADTSLGIATTISVVMHEIPQELSDFGVLVHGGMPKVKALFYNFVSGLAAVLGAIIGIFLSGEVAFFQSFLVPFAAGGFIYIATSDLIPQLHKEENLKKSMVSFSVFVAGIVFMQLLKLALEP